MTDSVSQGASEQGAPVVSVPGILVFIIADIIVFGMLFMSERMDQLVLFNRSAAALNVQLGLLNTVSSSPAACAWCSRWMRLATAGHA